MSRTKEGGDTQDYEIDLGRTENVTLSIQEFGFEDCFSAQSGYLRSTIHNATTASTRALFFRLFLLVCLFRCSWFFLDV